MGMMSLLNRWLALGTVVISSLLVITAFSFSCPWLVFFAYVPLCIFSLAGFSSLQSAMVWGGMAFICWFILLFPLANYSLWALGESAFVSYGLIALSALWSALPYALAGFLFPLLGCWLRRLRSALVYRICLLPLMALLFAFFTALWPVPFPAGLHLAVYPWVWFFQWAEWGGAGMLQFWVFLMNGLLAQFVFSFRFYRSFLWRSAFIYLGCFGILLGGGVLRGLHFERLETAALARRHIVCVALIQPSLPPSGIEHMDLPFPENYASDDLLLFPLSNAALFQQKKEGKSVDLVVWPEIPYPMNYEADQNVQTHVNGWVDRHRVPLLFCSTDYKNGEDEGRVQAHFLKCNPAVHRSSGKKKLIPFSEYLPLETFLPWLRRIFPRVNRFQPGNQYEPFYLAKDLRLAPLICYDDMFPEVVRQWKRNDANMILSLSNDSWFGDTPIQRSRLAAGLINVMQTRLPWLRAGNAGYTLAILPSGRILGWNVVPLYRRGFLIVEIPLI